MKGRKLIFITTILLLLLSSCSLEMMEEGKSVNEYIFPYTRFTLSEDKTYHSASILEGAAVETIYIPSLVDDNDGSSLPVKYFTGFENDEDIVNLTTTTFESSSTEIKLSSLDQASLLYTLKYNTVDEENTRWKNLPSLPHTEDEEFLGWFLVNNPTVRIYNGNVMVPGYTTLFPKWGKHNFKEVEKEDPTCTEAGWNSYHYCTNKNCDYTTKVELPALGHNLIKHEVSEATCIAKGYKEVCWECTRCHLYFSDERGENTISEERLKEIIVESAGHQKDENGYYSDEKYHLHVCLNCGKIFDTEDHIITKWTDIEGEDYVVGVCDKCSYSVTAPKKHNWSKVDAVEAGCTTSGHKEYYKCTNHSGEYTLLLDPVVIINSTELNEEVYISPLGHSFSEDYEMDDDYHWHLCTRTGCTASSEKEKHEFEYIFTQDGDRNFLVKRKCIKCGATGGSSSSQKAAFDVSGQFGSVKVERGDGNTWTISYYGECSSCYWTNESGERILNDADPFTISYIAEGAGEFKVFCYAFNSRNEIIDISFALLTAY